MTGDRSAAGDRHREEADLRRAVALEPDSVENLLRLAQFLADGGRIPDTAPILERVLQIRPGDPAAVSGILATSLYDPSLTPVDQARLHRAWVETLEAKLPPMPLRPQDWNPERSLTVAYLSADFREHSCAAFLEPLLAAHDHGRVRVLLLPTVAIRDDRTRRFEALADGWIEAWQLGDRELAERLQESGVDVLVDLGGHSACNRLAVLAYRPAPVQLAWLGYPFTTGLSRLQGRITDTCVDPPGAEVYSSEPLLRTDPCYLCWGPPGGGPEPAEAPCLRGEPFTFGSFNHFSKLNGAVVQVWAAILRRTPGSRLLLKGKGSQDPLLRQRILSAFEEEGVPGRRILLEGWAVPQSEHLAQYRNVDLALDPFPYNGCTTSIEALWMGVPFVALEGVHSLSRHGIMLLSQVGLQELAAATPAACVATAVELASHKERLSPLREGLRSRLLASPLCDARGFARRMEALYREEWRRACGSAQAGSGGGA